MTKPPRTPEQILARVVSSLDDAAIGLEDLVRGDPRRQWSGLKHMITSGRSVTFVLQKLRGRAPGFDAWYDPIRSEMKADPLMRYFSDLRNEVEKEGLPAPILAEVVLMKGGNQIAVAEVRVREDRHGVHIAGAVKAGHDPTAAKAQDSHYFRNIRLPNPPSEHLGSALTETAIDALGLRYIRYLRNRVVMPALEKFGDSGSV